MYAETAKEQLDMWDAGKTIWTVEMGGLGPGYEQAIQVCAVEITRDWIDKQLPDENDKEAMENFSKEFGEDTLKRIDEKLGGLTGAMFGAARHIAYGWLRHGPRKSLEQAPVDRRIQCSKTWVAVDG